MKFRAWTKYEYTISRRELMSISAVNSIIAVVVFIMVESWF